MEFVPDSWLVSSFVFSILWGVADVKTSLIGFTKPLYPGVFKAALLSKVKLSLTRVISTVKATKYDCRFFVLYAAY